MAIMALCWRCGRMAVAEDHLAGASVRCGPCGAPFQVPGSGGEICSCCGKDISLEKHGRDPAGKRFCPRCHTSRRQAYRPDSPGSLVICSTCRTSFAARDLPAQSAEGFACPRCARDRAELAAPAARPGSAVSAVAAASLQEQSPATAAMAVAAPRPSPTLTAKEPALQRTGPQMPAAAARTDAAVLIPPPPLPTRAGPSATRPPAPAPHPVAVGAHPASPTPPAHLAMPWGPKGLRMALAALTVLVLIIGAVLYRPGVRPTANRGTTQPSATSLVATTHPAGGLVDAGGPPQPTTAAAPAPAAAVAVVAPAVPTPAPPAPAPAPDASSAVRLVQPLDGTVLAAGSSIQLIAEAPGQIVRLEFYEGDRKIGDESKPPYTQSWKNIPPGRYTLTVKRVNNGGTAVTSPAVRLTVKSPGQ